MIETIKPCPCGHVPEALQINGQDRDKWATVSGSCCGEWSVEFRNQYARIPSAESDELARFAWNSAPRAVAPNDAFERGWQAAMDQVTGADPCT